MPRSTKKTAIILAAWAAFFALFAAGPAYAALPSLVPACARTGTETPSLNCLLQTFGNIAMLILGLTGSVALLMFVWGGFTFIYGGIAGKDSVEKGKKIIFNAVIGIVIIMTSGLLLQYGLKQLGVTEKTAIGQSCSGGGQVVQMPDGSTKCVKDCTEIKGSGFACIESSRGSYCIANLCPNDPRNIMCCRPQ